MAREFKPVRFFVLMGVAAFVACGVTVFFTHRAAHGRTAEERAAYEVGEKAGEQTPRDAKLPTDADPPISSEARREQASCRLGSRPSKTGTPTDSKRRILRSEPQ